METQKTPNSQSSLEKEEWSWRNQPSWFQTIIQSYSHQDSMVLTQKQKYKAMEKDRVQFSSVTQSCLTLCNRMDCSTPGLPVHHQLPEFNQTHVHWVGDAILSCRPLLLLPSIFPSIRVFSKWIKDLNVRPEVIKLSEENIGRTLNDINQNKIFHVPPPRVMEIKNKNKQVGPN